MTTNYGYEKSLIYPEQLLKLKEQPFEILPIDSSSAIVPHRIAIRTIIAEYPYIYNHAVLKIKIGNIEFGILPSSNFLEVFQNLFILINVNDCTPKLLSSVLGESLMLVNDGEDNLSEGNSCLEFHVFYSILEF
jgi:hypothetical protein